ncbi:MAG TPA: patatin-like phospholipase family protein [Kofleriaceae bacterium]|nr:patatin-like phospholipase family protein [Kofleriaceae bacterium]
MTTRIAVVLAGAVAKGAFEAGAIHELGARDVEILRVVGASSGALNGTVLARSVAARSCAQGAAMLVELWQDKASWTGVFHASLRELARRDGVSDRGKILALLREYVPVIDIADPAQVNLRLLVAALDGVTGAIGDHPATTYESLCEFGTADFTARDALDRVFDAATASSAFPLVFAPVVLPGIGPCVDGGAVNNTPFKAALDGAIGAQLDAIVVVATSVELRTAPTTALHGLALAGHLGEMLVGERLYRDLRDTEAINDGLRQLDALVARGAIDRDQLSAVLAAIRWTESKPVPILQVRPTADLPGSAFAGFFDAELRRTYIAAGAARASEVLDAARIGRLPQ